MHEGNVSTMPGYYIMIIALAVLVLLFITVVVYVKLYGYLETQRKNISSFYELGASKSVISGAFGSIARRASILCIAVSFVLGMGLNLLVLIPSDDVLALHPRVALFLAAVAAVIFIGFNLPVHRKLKSILARL
jgi:predicted lysophospholipase L1 biosynthesis ABC-type transport system permease subunit